MVQRLVRGDSGRTPLVSAQCSIPPLDHRALQRGHSGRRRRKRSDRRRGAHWGTEMRGRAFRVAGRSEFYEFTWLTATTGTLDRPYEGTTSATAGYSIFQNVYPLPADCRLVNDDAFSDMYGPMVRFTHGELNESDPSRIQTGTPRAWASYMDDSSTPPRMQVEIWPIPDVAIGIPFTYVGDAAPLTDTSTISRSGCSPLPWWKASSPRLKRT